MRWVSIFFSIEQSDTSCVPMKRSTFSTGCAGRNVASKKLESKGTFVTFVEMHDTVSDRKSPGLGVDRTKRCRLVTSRTISQS